MKNGGWMHRLGDPLPAKIYTKPEEIAESAPEIDADRLARRYRDDLSAVKLGELSMAIGVKRETLTRFEVGWDGNAWTFPMKNGWGTTVGIQRRFADGQKFCVKGSRLGCFVPWGVPGDQSDLIVVTEGASDAAAVIEAGFEAIGRPSCSTGADVVKRLVGKRDVVIVRDLDKPGIRGADLLAKALWWPGILLRIIDPLRGKDARAWHPCHDELQCVIENAYPWRPR